MRHPSRYQIRELERPKVADIPTESEGCIVHNGIATSGFLSIESAYPDLDGSPGKGKKRCGNGDAREFEAKKRNASMCTQRRTPCKFTAASA